MYQNVNVPPSARPTRGGSSWFHTLWVGLLLFIIATIILFATQNPNLYPTVLLIGNFLVPVVFVTFLYDHQHLSVLTPEIIGRSFGIGGILGVLGASVLEALLLPVASSNAHQGLSLGTAMLVGLIEEGCKAVAIIYIARRLPHTRAIDGLLLGGAVGMGFAALESTGYAFTAFVSSHGEVTASIISTVIRGLFAPFGHGIWSAILGSVLFSQSSQKHFRITIPVILTYLFVAFLHGLWDGLPLVFFLTIVVPPGFKISVATILLSVIGVIILTIIYRRALRQRLQQPQPQPPHYQPNPAQYAQNQPQFPTNQPLYPQNQQQYPTNQQQYPPQNYPNSPNTPTNT